MKSNKSKSSKVMVIDWLMGAASVIHPLTGLPQVFKIYTTQNVEGIALLTWVGFMVLGFIFLAYGIVHKITPFIIGHTMWLIIDAFIVAGILIYSS